MRACLYLLAFFLFCQNTAEATPEKWESAFGCSRDDARAYPLSTCHVVMSGGLRSSFDDPDAQLSELISIEHWQSFTPRPDSSALVLYKVGDAWRLEVFVWKTDPATYVEYGTGDIHSSRSNMMRSSNVIVSDARIQAFRNAHPFPRAPKPYEKIVMDCADSAQLSMHYASRIRTFTRVRNVCQERGGLDEFAEALVSLAIELDPGLAPYADVFTITGFQ